MTAIESDLTVPAPNLLTDYYLDRAREDPEGIAFFSLRGRDWEPTSWQEFVAEARRLANALAAAGLEAGERLGIMAPTGLAWELFQLAGLLNGAAIVGLDAHDQPERLRMIANTGQLAGIVIGDATCLNRFDCSQVSTLRFVVSLEDDPAPAGLSCAWLTMTSLEGAAIAERALVGPAPGSLATIVFTSGSTGEPKGIGYSHAQVCLAIENILEAFPEITASDRLVCWLPLSNLFQRMLNFCAAGRGARSYFVSEPRAVITHLPEIRPNVFIAVPRFFEKLNEGIEQRLAQRSPLAKAFTRWAIEIGDKAAAVERSGKPLGAGLKLNIAIADRLVLRKLRAIMGGEIHFMVSGSAAFPRWLLEKFHAMGLLVLEAYGLSENVVPIAINRLHAYRFGTVGTVLGANTVKIAEDGEVMVHGQGVFNGYLNHTEATAIDDAGFLATGDLGVIDEDGYLALVGRKSEVFKTSTGRKVAPLGIEAKLKRIAGIDHVMLVGAGRKTTAALITLAPDPNGALPDASALRAEARRIAGQINHVLEGELEYARPAGLAISRRIFSVDAGELTSNLKLRRQIIEMNYHPVLEGLFSRLEVKQDRFCELVSDDVCVVNCEGMR